MQYFDTPHLIVVERKNSIVQSIHPELSDMLGLPPILVEGHHLAASLDLSQGEIVTNVITGIRTLMDYTVTQGINYTLIFVRGVKRIDHCAGPFYALYQGGV